MKDRWKAHTELFDLIGLFDLRSEQPPTLPPIALPAIRWGKRDLAAHTVSGRGLSTVYVEHSPAAPSYHAEGGLHLLTIGEAWLRSDERKQRPDSKHSRPLPACEILALYLNEPDRFIRCLKGNFTLVIVDEVARRITFCNSRFGISPFYYALVGARLFFSTSLAAIAACISPAPELDPAGVAELALFNYPLGGRTYFKGVQMLRPAEIIRVDASGTQHETYWDVRTLYDVSLLPQREAWEAGAVLFHRTVNDLAADQARVRLSFTSGFDSRAVLSVLDKEPADVLGYSFGIAGSLNINIPQQIAVSVGLPFVPIVLDGEYESVFDEYALRALLLSDCLSTIERANYPYAFKQLADFSPVVITGLFGSELLRTFQNVGHIVSEGLARINLSTDPCRTLRRMLAESETLRYFAPTMVRRAAPEVEADVNAVLTERFGAMSADRRFYMFLLTEGLRKYFGAELQTERPYGVNRFPFLDDEFVEFLFRAPFAGVYSRTLRPTVGNRYHSQYFYAYIIRKYRPELLAAPTDHGYPPRDILSPLALLIIGPKLAYRRWRGNRGYREFKTEEWTKAFYRNNLFRQPVEMTEFTPALQGDFESGKWLANRLEFARAASLKIWLERIR